MKSKIFIIGLLLVAILSAGCLDFIVYPGLERVYPDPFGATGTVTDQHLMGGDKSDFGRFTAGDAGTVAFGNSIDPVTKTVDSEKFTVNIKYADVTSAQPAGQLTLRIVNDNGVTEDHPLMLIDFDGSTHTTTVQSNQNFKHYDLNGDGVISILLAHDASDLNTINVYYMWLDVDYTTTPTTPTTSTGDVEFYTDPTGASVLVDGIYKGDTAAYTYGVLSVTLSEGSHTYTISKDGYNSKSGTVNVDPTQIKTITESLTVATPTNNGDNPTSNIAPAAIITTVQPSKDMVVFNSDKSTDQDGTIVNREWLLNGKSVSSAVQYQFSTANKDAGSYTVQLTVTDNGGATGAAQYIITVDENTITQTKEITTPTDTTTPTGDNIADSDKEGMVFVLPGFDIVLGVIGLVSVFYFKRRQQ